MDEKENIPVLTRKKTGEKKDYAFEFFRQSGGKR